MASSYRIPVQIGYSDELSFRIAPVNRAIMNADADWPFSHELCLDGKAATALILPFISQHSKREPEAGEEINLISFTAARRICRDLKITAAMLKDDYDNPVLSDLKEQVTLDMLLPRKNSSEEEKEPSKEEIEKLRRDNFFVIVIFFNETANLLNSLIESFEKKGYQHFAVTFSI